MLEAQREKVDHLHQSVFGYRPLPFEGSQHQRNRSGTSVMPRVREAKYSPAREKTVVGGGGRCPVREHDTSRSGLGERKGKGLQRHQLYAHVVSPYLPSRPCGPASLRRDPRASAQGKVLSRLGGWQRHRLSPRKHSPRTHTSKEANGHQTRQPMCPSRLQPPIKETSRAASLVQDTEGAVSTGLSAESRPTSHNRFYCPIPPPSSSSVLVVVPSPPNRDADTSVKQSRDEPSLVIEENEAFEESRDPVVPARHEAASRVVERLYSENCSGPTAMGRRVLRWATGAGVDLTPPRSEHFRQCQAYAGNPKANAAAWRRLCQQGRIYFLKHGIATTVGGQTARSADISILSGLPFAENPNGGPPQQQEEAGTAEREHRNRHRTAFADRRPGEGLRAYRTRIEHARWCRWQLLHFYEQGSVYLSSVWKQKAKNNLAFLFTGRFVVPTESRIEANIHRVVQEQRKAIFLRDVLFKEVGLDVHEDHNKDSEPRGQDEPSIEGSSSQTGPRGCSTEVSAEDVTPARAQRASDTLMAQEPYVYVAFNPETGLLDLSVYVHGTEDGEGATFLAKSTAACLDNFRWLVLDGLWRDQTIFFIPQQRAMTWCTGGNGVSSESANAPSKGASQSNVTPCSSHTVDDIQLMVVDGVCLEKLQTADHQAATSDARDLYMCKRCGQVRRRGSASAHGSRGVSANDAAGFLFCRLCGRRSAHTMVSPAYASLKERLGSWAAERRTDTALSRAEVEAWLNAETGASAGAGRGAQTVGAALLTNGRRQRPSWVGCTHVDASKLLAVAPSLAAPPLTTGKH